MIKNCTIEIATEETEVIHTPIWVRCKFIGRPPLGFASWQDFLENAHKSGVFTGIKIESINKI
jgi:hypothetical protein